MSEPGGVKQIQSVSMAFEMLETMVRLRGAEGVTEIARRLGVPKARAHRYLATLRDLGCVEQDPVSGKYRLGIRLYHLGRAAGDQQDLLAAAKPIMQALCERLGLTISLSRPTVDGLLLLDMVRAFSPIEISVKPGYLVPLHATAQGKVALAFGGDDLREAVDGAELWSCTEQTIRDHAALTEEVGLTRRRGWAVAPGETLPGLNALAVPVYGAEGELAATLAAVGTTQTVPRDPGEDLLEPIRQAGRDLSGALGYLTDARGSPSGRRRIDSRADIMKTADRT